MKRSYLLMAALLLGACAPTVSSSTPKADPFGGGFSAIGLPPVVWFKAGQSDVFDLVVTIMGDDLRINAPGWCKALDKSIKCTVPTLVAGQNFVLPMKGSHISAVATYKRSGGLNYSSTVRQ